MGLLPFEAFFRSSGIILTEGAIVERLRREFSIPLDENIVHAGFIYNSKYRIALSGIYKQYLDIAEAYNLTIMIMTPTRRANLERIALSEFKDRRVIADNVDFLNQLKAGYKTPVYIGGLTGCMGDAYSSSTPFTLDEAIQFHTPTMQSFREAGVDFLFAGIMPTVTESIAIANSMETTGLPYIISFMIRRAGVLIDGTTIHDAIATIDKNTQHQPLCYMANCIHPDILHEALSHPANRSKLVKTRFQGIQANASSLSPEELNESKVLCSSSAEELTERMLHLHADFSLKIYGGCCGTNEKHLRKIAEAFQK